MFVKEHKNDTKKQKQKKNGCLALVRQAQKLLFLNYNQNKIFTL